MKKLLATLLLAITAAAHAGEHHESRRAAPPAAAAALAQAGVQALEARDYPSAVSQLERAYALAPSADLLFHLGQAASGQRRSVAAADLLRRYLEEAGPGVDPQRRALIEQQLAAQRAPVNEITVAGERGALLWVDERLAGVLPLALPLLIAPGNHRLRLAKGQKQVETQVSLPAGRQAEVRFTLSPAVALVNMMQAVMLRVDCQGAPPGCAGRVERAVAAALTGEHAILVRPPVDAPPCPDPLVCLEQHARRADAQFVLSLRAASLAGSTDPQDLRFDASLYDVAIGAEAAQSSASCTPCSDGAAAQKLAQVVGKLLLDGTTRARGTLLVAATDASAVGASVRVDNRAPGAIPYERETFAGPHSVRIERPGHLPKEEPVTIAEGQTTRLRVRLLPIAAPAPPRRRPLRLAGWSLVGVGLSAVVTGAVLWGLDGKIQRSCSAQPPGLCAETWDGLGSGLPFVGVGALVIGAGGLLLGLDARRESAAAPALLAFAF